MESFEQLHQDFPFSQCFQKRYMAFFEVSYLYFHSLSHPSIWNISIFLWLVFLFMWWVGGSDVIPSVYCVHCFGSFFCTFHSLTPMTTSKKWKITFYTSKLCFSCTVIVMIFVILKLQIRKKDLFLSIFSSFSKDITTTVS